MQSLLSNKKVIDLVDENYIYASILNLFGIEFYQDGHYTLKQVCKDKSIDVRVVVKKLKSYENDHDLLDKEHFNSLPILAIIDYLKHAHNIFVRKRLPYMAKIIHNISPECFDKPNIASDLKFIFPLFVEDFIQHIYDEHEVFNYIEKIEKALKEDFELSKIYYKLNQFSIEEIFLEHSSEDDEMIGIRDLTNDYSITSYTTTHTKVVYSELKNFEYELKKHAQIENLILFPRALSLEKQAKLKVVERAKLN